MILQITTTLKNTPNINNIRCILEEYDSKMEILEALEYINFLFLEIYPSKFYHLEVN